MLILHQLSYARQKLRKLQLQHTADIMMIIIASTLLWSSLNKEKMMKKIKLKIAFYTATYATLAATIAAAGGGSG